MKSTNLPKATDPEEYSDKTEKKMEYPRLVLNLDGINNENWKKAGIKMPAFDIELMRKETEENPIWIHFGAGNIFRGFIALLQQRLEPKRQLAQ